MKRICLAALGAALCSAPSLADHSWGPYHWARTTTSFDLTIVNSTTPDWDGYVTQAIGDWSQSTKLNMIDVASDDSSKTRRRCQGPDGQIRICNLAYGNTGWLGIAGISIDSAGHITTGYTKLNDTYFSEAFYDETWKQSVTCQELGHNVGLDHQDENFNNGSLFTCMDYQNPPYEFPNDHDFVQLETIYGHTDAYDSYVTGADSGGGGGGGGGCNGRGRGCGNGASAGFAGEIGWGISLGRRGQQETFLRVDPDGTRHLTHVTWAIGF